MWPRQVAYIVVSAETSKKKDKSTTCVGFKVDAGGKLLASKKYDTGNKGLNIHAHDQPGGSLAWNPADNTLGLIIARTMTISSDGLNHQGAIAVVLDASDMSVIQNYGQTSGHSLGNSLHVASDGSFLGADLGDNYPRGIHLHNFSKSVRRRGKVVYTFKTKHSTNKKQYAAKGKTWPLYKEISTKETKFYKQSNDNEV